MATESRAHPSGSRTRHLPEAGRQGFRANSQVPIRWDKSLYYRMAEMGWFEGKRVELIRGEILTKPRTSPRHVVGAAIIVRAFIHALNDEFAVYAPGILELSADTVPEPDIAVVRAKYDDFIDSYPIKADLVVEVSDSSLRYDRTTKTGIYAAAVIPEYWIINLIKNVVEVRRDPVQAEATYGDMRVYVAGEYISPLAKPEARILVDDLLPADKRRKRPTS